MKLFNDSIEFSSKLPLNNPSFSFKTFRKSFCKKLEFNLVLKLEYMKKKIYFISTRFCIR
jgi:hypothetical protein